MNRRLLLRTIPFLLLLIVLAIGGPWFYLAEKERMQREAEEDLQAVADLKVREMSLWRRERLADAAVLAENPLLVERVAEWMTDPRPETGERLVARFESLRDHYDYSDVLLVEPGGEIRMSLSGVAAELHPDAAHALAEAMATGECVLSRLHVGPADGAVHVAAVAPLFASAEPDGPAVGAVLLRSDAEDFLYPLIQDWPTPSDSAESLLVRREGESVLFLNDLRHEADAALARRIPVARADLPAAMAIRGAEGVTRGVDYRGVKVLAALKKVPDSPWFMVAKVDEAEVLAVWRQRSFLIVAAIIGFALASAVGAGLLWQAGAKRHYRSLYEAETGRRLAEQRHHATLVSIGDGVIAADADGRVEMLNPVAEELTGWTEAEALNRPIGEVFRIVNERTRQSAANPVARVLDEGVVVGLANSTVLIARDGRERPIADSGAPIHDEDGRVTGAVLVFRDQTEERAAQRAIRTERDNLRAVLAASPVAVMVFDADERITHANPAAERMFATTLTELERRRCGDMLACVNRARAADGCGYAEQCASCGLRKAIREALEGRGRRRVEDAEVVLDMPAGPVRRWLEFSVEPMTFNGQPHAVAALHDVTERKETEIREQHVAEMLRVIRRINQLITQEKDPATLIERACRELTETRGYAVAWVALFDRAGRVTQTAQSGADSDAFERFRADLTAGREPACWAELPDDDVSLLHAGEPLCRGCPLQRSSARAVIRARLRHDGRTWGIMEAVLPAGRTDDGEEMDLFSELTDDLALALHAIDRDNRLAESERKHRLLAENTLDVIWAMDMDLTFRYVNRAIADLTGETPAEWIGTRLPDHCTAEAFETMREVIERELAKGPAQQGVVFETEMLRKDGSTIPVEIHGQVIFDESGRPASLQGTTRDITVRKQAEEALADSERKFRSYVENAPTGVFVADEDGRYLDVNPAGCRMTGYDRDELLGMSISDLVSDEHRQEALGHFDRLKAEGSARSGPFPYIGKDGDERWWTIDAVCLDDGRYLAFCQDVTHRQQLEEQLRQSQKMEAVGRLAGGVAHDFRNQLTVITGYGEMLLRRGEVADDGLEKVREIVKAADRSATLAGQLLAFGRKQTLQVRDVDLTALLTDMSRPAARLIGEDIRLNLVPSAEPCVGRVDPGQLQQAVMNLVINARDAMPGGGKLTVRSFRMTPDEAFRRRRPDATADAYAGIEVTDTGCGMDQSTQEKLFEPFFTTKEVGKGTGLGLSMVYGFVKQSGGIVDVESAPGEGSTFRLLFPACEPSESDRVEARHAPTDTPGGDETLLLAEDEPAVREMMADVLREAGYTVIESDSVADALEKATSDDAPADMLVTDVVMPEGSGVDLARELRARFDGLPILFVSGYGQQELDRRGMELADARIISKPCDHDELLEIVREMLDGGDALKTS